MQVTSSLLRNLLDVTEEVQQAQIEIRNLVKTSFSSPSGITPPPNLPGHLQSLSYVFIYLWVWDL
jgi:hypothetical protein